MYLDGPTGPRWAGYRRKRRQAPARVMKRAQELMKKLPPEAKTQA
jgi:hypothetical protein